MYFVVLRCKQYRYYLTNGTCKKSILFSILAIEQYYIICLQNKLLFIDLGVPAVPKMNYYRNITEIVIMPISLRFQFLTGNLVIINEQANYRLIIKFDQGLDFKCSQGFVRYILSFIIMLIFIFLETILFKQKYIMINLQFILKQNIFSIVSIH